MNSQYNISNTNFDLICKQMFSEFVFNNQNFLIAISVYYVKIRFRQTWLNIEEKSYVFPLLPNASICMYYSFVQKLILI